MELNSSLQPGLLASLYYAQAERCGKLAAASLQLIYRDREDMWQARLRRVHLPTFFLFFFFFFFFLHQNTCREISDCTNSFITFSMYSLSQTGETDLCQVFTSPRATQAKREFCVTGPSFFWFSSQFEICEKIQFEQSTLFNSETSSRPPESKPDVLIRPKDNK